MTILRISIICILLAGCLFSQPNTAIVGINYVWNITPEPIAPGQILTLLVRGVRAPSTQAGTVPLPTELSGVKVVIEEPSRSYRTEAPILRIDQITCGNGLIYVCDVTAITIQVPTEIGGLTVGASFALRPVITIIEAGVVGYRTEFALSPVAVHVLGDCDVVLRRRAGSCSGASIVTHADGTLVSAANPATLGQELVLYVVGLGSTSPSVATGTVVGTPAPTAVNEVLLNFGANTVLATPVPDETWSRASFAGLVPGFVGLYQVNFRLPDEVPDLRQCLSANNLAIIIASRGSVDVAQICVK